MPVSNSICGWSPQYIDFYRSSTSQEIVVSPLNTARVTMRLQIRLRRHRIVGLGNPPLRIERSLNNWV